jgi:hypothetical protein
MHDEIPGSDPRDPVTLARMRTAPQTAVIGKGDAMKELLRKRIAPGADLVATVSPTTLTFSIEVTGADPARPSELKRVFLQAPDVQALIALAGFRDVPLHDRDAEERAI